MTTGAPMTVQLSPEQERLIGQAIRAGLIQAPDDVIAAGIAALRERLEAHPDPGTEMAPEEWTRELHEWIHSHSTSTPILAEESVERDSIYGTRGL
jgi:hypothetical protein